MATNMINLKINGVDVSVPEGTRIIDAAKKVGFNIPTLCFLRGINNDSSCRICVVEVKGARSLMTACSATVTEGMVVTTNSPKVMKSRKMSLELILSNHRKDCLSCVRNKNCELQTLSSEYGCDEHKFDGGATTPALLDEGNAWLVRDNSKCILCRRCERMCKNIQSVGVIGANKRGFDTYIGCAFEQPLDKNPCVACGQCITVCPTGALHEKDGIQKTVAALNDPSKHVIVGTAPSVRVGLGEEFGYPIGTDVEGKMVTALKMLGFNKVFDIDMTADLTIMEEGTEFISRLKDPNAALPMLTSCSPGWVRYIEMYYPELLPHVSSCKSPQQMFGAVMKTYYAEKNGIDPKDICVVSVMPCVAKKFEITRDDQSASGYPDVDVVLTSRELARLIKGQGINFTALENGEFDNPIGEGSTAGLLFGVTGGVMEAALRTVSEVLEGKPLEKLDFKAVRGIKGIKKATVTINGQPVKVAVAHSIDNAKTILEEIKSGKADYSFVEIMTCPGGCVNGGGQPIQPACVRNFTELPVERAKAIYSRDRKAKLRKSHENPIMKKLYGEYFGEPNSHKAHEILHTKYTSRKKY